MPKFSREMQRREDSVKVPKDMPYVVDVLDSTAFPEPASLW